MTYFISDIKKLYRSRMVQVMLLLMTVVAIADPLFVRFVYGRQPGFFEQIGANPFQFWLLMNSSGWGNTVYHTLLFVFPVLSTGLVFFRERQSSMYELLLSRNSRKKYLASKAASVFCTTFFNFLLILFLNLAVTHLCFSMDAPLTEQYGYSIPKAGTFADFFYQISPVAMEVLYVFLNALAIALLAVFVLGMHMIFRFQNYYVAFLVPFLVLYAGNYVRGVLRSDSLQYSISIIMQPRAASSLPVCITVDNVLMVYGVLLVIDLIALFIGFKRNRDAL